MSTATPPQTWTPDTSQDVMDNLVTRFIHEGKPEQAEYIRAIVGQHRWHDKSAADRNVRAKKLLKRASAFSILSTLLAVLYSLGSVDHQLVSGFVKYALPILVAVASAGSSYFTMVLNTDKDDKLAITEREYAMRSRFALYDLAGGVISYEDFVERMGGAHSNLTEQVVLDKKGSEGAVQDE